MAAGQEVLIQDLPAELFEATAPENSSGRTLPDSWATLLAQWADRALRTGSSGYVMMDGTCAGDHHFIRRRMYIV